MVNLSNLDNRVSFLYQSAERYGQIDQVVDGILNIRIDSQRLHPLRNVHMYMTCMSTEEAKKKVEESGLTLGSNGLPIISPTKAKMKEGTEGLTKWPVLIVSNRSAEDFYSPGKHVPHISKAQNLGIAPISEANNLTETSEIDRGERTYCFSLWQVRDRESDTAKGAAAFLNAVDRSVSLSPEKAADALDTGARELWPRGFKPRNN